MRTTVSTAYHQPGMDSDDPSHTLDGLLHALQTGFGYEDAEWPQSAPRPVSAEEHEEQIGRVISCLRHVKRNSLQSGTSQRWRQARRR